jgi:hypothetical protein
MTPEERARAAVLARLRRPGGPPAPIRVRRRPSVILTVEKPVPDGPPLPESGTVTIDSGVTRLYVGRGWHPGQGVIAAFADELLGQVVVEIIGTTGVAGARAKKLLGAAWRLGDIIASGQLTGDAAAAMQAALERL